MVLKMEEQKEFKAENLNESNKKEGEKVLFPFRKKRTQRYTSITGLIIGVLLMISSPIFRLGTGLTISGFILGTIVFFISLLYFLDAQ